MNPCKSVWDSLIFKDKSVARVEKPLGCVRIEWFFGVPFKCSAYQKEIISSLGEENSPSVANLSDSEY